MFTEEGCVAITITNVQVAGAGRKEIINVNRQHEEEV
jgi:hypothetical protein